MLESSGNVLLLEPANKSDFAVFSVFFARLQSVHPFRQERFCLQFIQENLLQAPCRATRRPLNTQLRVQKPLVLGKMCEFLPDIIDPRERCAFIHQWFDPREIYAENILVHKDRNQNRKASKMYGSSHINAIGREWWMITDERKSSDVGRTEAVAIMPLEVQPCLDRSEIGRAHV